MTEKQLPVLFQNKLETLLCGLFLFSFLETFIKIYFFPFLIKSLFIKTYLWLEFLDLIVGISYQVFMFYIIFKVINNISNMTIAYLLKSFCCFYIVFWVFITPLYRIASPITFFIIMLMEKIYEI